MIILRSNDNLEERSIFLAGPTLRTDGSAEYRWREEAIEIFEEKKFDGALFLPEPFAVNYDTQIKWEEKHLELATCIMFWVPRNMETLPALTTNVEFGEWMKSKKIVLGYPDDAVSMDYLHTKAVKYAVPTSHTLRATIDSAINMVDPHHCYPWEVPDE
jgi:hypothetical protein